MNFNTIDRGKESFEQREPDLTHSADTTSQRRLAWDKAFAAMAERGDDRQFHPEISNFWDETEWEW